MRFAANYSACFSTAASPGSSASSLKQLLCCLPTVELKGIFAHLTYDNVFRVLIMQFLDARNFGIAQREKDLRAYRAP